MGKIIGKGTIGNDSGTLIENHILQEFARSMLNECDLPKYF